MKNKQLFKMLALILIILFVSLYVTQLSNYYKYFPNRKNILTEEAIERFEEDISEGKEINQKNYLVEEKNYNNSFTKLGMRISVFIEKSFNKTMNTIFNEINEAINDQ